VSTHSTSEEIRQRAPFHSPAHEASVSLLLTADRLNGRFNAMLAPFGITGQQYNVLRILRGAGPSGMPTLAIAERMIEQVPGITRLLDRIEAKGLVRRERCAEDRRQMFCYITPAGAALLAQLDEPVTALHQQTVGRMSRKDVLTLLDLLARVRASL